MCGPGERAASGRAQLCRLSSLPQSTTMAAARVYSQLLEAHPNVTLAVRASRDASRRTLTLSTQIINGTLSTIGDCCAQVITVSSAWRCKRPHC